MSLLLARIARTLTHHWIRGLLGAFVVLVALIIAAGAGGEAADDFSTPGTESQKAIDLFQAHTPALAGLEATLVFYTEDGKITDPDKQAAIEETLAKVKQLDAQAAGLGPVRRGRHDLAGRQARVRRRPLHGRRQRGQARATAAR